MNSFQRKSLFAALAGAGALGATTGAEAVNVNPNGLGQVLIYPYYTVRNSAAGNAYNSLLTVVNSTDSVKAVKVRFLEGKNSREVIDFNLFLSAYDVWTAGVVPTAAGGRVLVTDHSCTVPPISTSQGGAGFVDFVNFAYFSGGNSPDKGGDSLDRTREGYVEIIEMTTYTSTDTVAVTATHVSGTPPCKLSVLTGTLPVSEGLAPSGGLFGGMTLINVNDGTDFTEDAVALDNFSATPIYNDAGTTFPDFTFVFPPRSQVLAQNAVFTSTWGVPPSQNIDAVSAVLMHDQVMNVFVVDASIAATTDWVVTFPTKRFPAYINVGTGLAPRLFQRNFNDGVGSCDDVAVRLFDREEFRVNILTFSPPPPQGVNQLCWEANVITFNGGNVLGSTNNVSITTSFQNGWLNLGFFPPTVTGAVHRLINTTNTCLTSILGATTCGLTETYNGLPVVGFEVESYKNNTLVIGGASVLSNYGGNFVHKYTTVIN